MGQACKVNKNPIKICGPGRLLNVCYMQKCDEHHTETFRIKGIVRLSKYSSTLSQGAKMWSLVIHRGDQRIDSDDIRHPDREIGV